MNIWLDYKKGMEEEGKRYDIKVKSGVRRFGYTYRDCWFDGLYFCIPGKGRTDREFVFKIRERSE